MLCYTIGWIFFCFLLPLENSEDAISFSECTAFHVPVTKEGLQHYSGVGFKWSTHGSSTIISGRDQQALYLELLEVSTD